MSRKYDWRSKKELLLGIEYPEDKEKKKKIAAAIRKRNQEKEEEEQAMWERGICPICHIIKTTNGECSMRNTIICS